jgi:hypothetical protein
MRTEQDVDRGRTGTEDGRKRGGYLRVILRIARLVLLIGVGLSVIVVGVSWVIGWRSPEGYAAAFRYAALAVLAIGATAVLGGRSLNRKTVTASTRSQEYYKRRLLGLENENFEFLFVAFLVAAVLYGIGEMIYRSA